MRGCVSGDVTVGYMRPASVCPSRMQTNSGDSSGDVWMANCWDSRLCARHPSGLLICRRPGTRRAVLLRCGRNQTLRWHGDITRFRILDKRDKTVAALTVRQGELETAGPTSLEAPTVVTLEPLKGFESAAEDVRQAIFDALDAPMVSVSLVPELHAHAGVNVAGVSSKFAARLAPERPRVTHSRACCN